MSATPSYDDIVIVDTARTPSGRYRGALSTMRAPELGKIVATALLDRYPNIRSHIGHVYMGNVIQAGTGQNTARQVALSSGLDASVPATTVNQVCGSGLKSIMLGRDLLRLGEANVVLAGGTESMSQAPLISRYNATTGEYFHPVSSLVEDGLVDAFSGRHMGETAQHLADYYGISRGDQDAFSVQSHMRAIQATDKGYFSEEIIPVTVTRNEDSDVSPRHSEIFSRDEGLRPDTSVKKLAQLNPAFDIKGSITAGNASTLNDGAAGALLTTRKFAEDNNLPALAIIRDAVEIGVDPAQMAISPSVAIPALLKRSSLSIDDINLFEINEAFAASSLIVNKLLGLNNERVNIDGGALSIGHPIGASGARIVGALARQLRRRNERLGIASLCVGGGIGLAILLENSTYSSERVEAHADTQIYGIK